MDLDPQRAPGLSRSKSTQKSNEHPLASMLVSERNRVERLDCFFNCPASEGPRVPPASPHLFTTRLSSFSPLSSAEFLNAPSPAPRGNAVKTLKPLLLRPLPHQRPIFHGSEREKKKKHAFRQDSPNPAGGDLRRSS